jgi:hypothetical protein
MKIIRYLFLAIMFFFVIQACEENGRYAINSSDDLPPDSPVVREIRPLYGGARIFYTIPSNEDLLSINAEFSAANGKIFKFSASYFADSLDVYGLGDTVQYTINLYASDRAGNKSTIVPVVVKPLEPAVSRVANTLTVKPGFSSFYVDWFNELEQTVNVYVDFSFTQKGNYHDMVMVFSSNLLEERKFINDLELTENEPVSVKVRVEDIYGNITEPIDFGQFTLYQDEQISKDNWILPLTNDSIAGVPMCFGNGFDGRIYRVIDGAIDLYESSNYMHTGTTGRTGMSVDGNVPWNLIIDLGDYYELSRIITHQRHSGGSNGLSRGQYYQSENVGIYNMYILDENLNEWILVSQHQIPTPVGLNDLEIVRLGDAGDMAYMYPDDPKYTQSTRWFRYEALWDFTSNYTGTGCNCLSEVTLFGRRTN